MYNMIINYPSIFMKSIFVNLSKLVFVLFFSISGSVLFFSNPVSAVECPQGEPSNTLGCCYTGSTGGSDEWCVVDSCSGGDLSCPSLGGDYPFTTGGGGTIFDEVNDEILIIEPISESLDGDNTNIYIIDRKPIINIEILEKDTQTETAIGRVADEFFVVMRDFYKNIFSFFGGEKSLGEDLQGVIDDAEVGRGDCVFEYDCPPRIRLIASCGYEPSWDWYCDNATFVDFGEDEGVYSPTVDENGVQVEIDILSEKENTEKNLYCEIASDLSAAQQKIQIQSCVNSSDLSEGEKQSVINSLR
jgi:hypothetical protein